MKLFKNKKINLLLFLNLFCFKYFLVPDKTFPTSENKNIPSGDLLKIKISDEAIDLNSLVFIDGEGFADLKRLKKSIYFWLNNKRVD